MSERWKIHLGDCTEVLRSMPSDSFDALLSDPPYGLSFMGRRWDYDVPSVDFWREALRVLKPGAPVLAFSGTRTYHRMVCAMEDAGFEIRDCIAWMYGSGFPKSLAIDKAIDKHNGDARPVVGPHPNPGSTNGRTSMGDGWQSSPNITSSASAASAAWAGHGTALKPAHEPCVLAMKPTDGTFAENAMKHGVAGISIDACRIECGGPKPLRETQGNVGENVVTSFDLGSRRAVGFTDEGRWPANVILDEESASLLDAQSGERPGMSGGGVHRPDYAGGMFGAIDAGHLARNDTGGASRFFYVAKASRAERDFGCEHMPKRSGGESCDREQDSDGLNSPRAGAGRNGGSRNFHPTVKPITLMRYLATMILPPVREDGSPRRLLVPFAGSGSEMIGAMRAGWDRIEGIERDPEYRSIAIARLARWSIVPEYLDEADVSGASVEDDDRQVDMFSGRVGSGGGGNR